MKLKINYLTYLYLILALLSGLFKSVVTLIIVIIFHELGHIVMIKLLKYPINSITIYPFGGIIQIDKLINSKISHDLLIGIGGILGQTILLFFTIILKHNISFYYYQLLINYNLTIIFLNLFLIYPLDGYHLMNYLLNYVFSFEIAYHISLLLNTINVILIFILLIKYRYLNIPIIFICFYSLLALIKVKSDILHRFYLERLYHRFYYRKINYLKYNHKKYLKREILSFYQNNHQIFNEIEIICKK